MAARKSLDFNQIAHRVVSQATGGTPPTSLESAAKKKVVKKRKAQAKKASARKIAAKAPAKKARQAS
jgi:hypothetical protein